MAPKVIDDLQTINHDMDNVLLDDSKDLNVQWKGEYEIYDTKKQTIYVNCNLRAPECPEQNRKPIDVVIVLDRSGSMCGQKLDLCLKTIRFLIEQLSHQDRLSIITYATTVTTNIVLTKMDEKGKTAIREILSSIHAGSSTNLSGGLLNGLQEIQSPKRQDEDSPNPIKSVLLLTDGLANHGITSTEGMVQMLQGSMQSDVSLFTFGYGNEHNVEMLRQISEVGRGVYYFVKDVDDVTVAFANCLGGLLSVTAQNIKIDFRSTNGCEIISVKTKKDVKTIIPQKHFEVDIGDLYGEEERDILIVVQIPELELEELEEKVQIIQSTVTYANILSSSLAQHDSHLIIKRSKKVQSERIPDGHVLVQKNRIRTANTIDQALKTARDGKIDDCKKYLRSNIEELKKTIKDLSNERDEELTSYFIDDLKSCEKMMVSSNRLSLQARNKMSGSAQMYHAQRLNRYESDEVKFLGSFTNMNPGVTSARCVLGDMGTADEKVNVPLGSPASENLRTTNEKGFRMRRIPFGSKAKTAMMAKARKFSENN